MRNVYETMRNKILHPLAMAAVAACLWACADESIVEPAGSPQGADIRGAESHQVALNVSEQGWQGETVSVTRGATLDALKSNSSRSWDFTKTPAEDVAALAADGTNWTKESDKQYQYKNALAAAALQAGGVNLSFCDGLLFTASAEKVEIIVGEKLYLGGKDIVMTLPALKKGQIVTVEFSTSSDSKSRNIIPGGNVSSTEAVASSSTSTHAECTVTMTADGSPTFTVGEGTEGNSVYIYSITVSPLPSDGFGLFSTRLGLTNMHVVWNNELQRWESGSTGEVNLLWPNNVVKYSVAFNGSDEASPTGYFSFTGEHNFNAKFTGCTYQGIQFTKGLKMEEGAGGGKGPTTISFTSGSTGSNKVKVTIVQSDWKEGENVATIKFDGVALDVARAQPITGGRVYTIRDVAAGNHSITRGDGESGIFYVSVDIDFTAYAPYVPATDAVVTSLDNTALTFVPALGNTVDLLWAEDMVSTDGTVTLNFKHALGKLTLGTISNNYGQNVTLTDVTLSGSRYTQATLSLITGEWSNPTNSSATKSFNSGTVPTLAAMLGGSATIADGSAASFVSGSYYLQIPGRTITVSYTFTSAYGTETVSKDVVLEQGKDKTLNLIIGQNHEVVIQ